MPKEKFEKIVTEVASLTKKIALHMGGDPLVLSDLADYLDIAGKNGLKVELTTSGFYTAKHSDKVLLHDAIRQINFSLNSYDKNSSTLSLDEYLAPIFEITERKLSLNKEIFINLRVWNDKYANADFNEIVLEKISSRYGIKIYPTGERRQRSAQKTVVVFDDYFEWPNLSSKNDTDSFCYGLGSHFGILSDGSVVPCCLDKDGVITLGNAFTTPIAEILSDKRANAIRDGFLKREAIEELCRRCTYKHRFQSACTDLQNSSPRSL